MRWSEKSTCFYAPNVYFMNLYLLLIQLITGFVPANDKHEQINNHWKNKIHKHSAHFFVALVCFIAKAKNLHIKKNEAFHDIPTRHQSMAADLKR